GAVQLMGVGYLMNGISQGVIPVVAGIIIAVVCAISEKHWQRGNLSKIP
ncbi:unnamed protein product, partial [marine sediment metagenome]